MATMWQRLQDAAKRPKVIGPPRSDTVPAGINVTGTDPSTLERRVDILRRQNPTVVNQQVVRTPEEVAAEQTNQESMQAEERRKRGRAATLLTGGTGLLGSPSTSRRSLMGY